MSKRTIYPTMYDLKNIDNFCIPDHVYDWFRDGLGGLPDDELLRVFRAIYAYHLTGKGTYIDPDKGAWTIHKELISKYERGFTHMYPDQDHNVWVLLLTRKIVENNKIDPETWCRKVEEV
jgi:hypothetical protein